MGSSRIWATEEFLWRFESMYVGRDNSQISKSNCTLMKFSAYIPLLFKLWGFNHTSQEHNWASAIQRERDRSEDIGLTQNLVTEKELLLAQMVHIKMRQVFVDNLHRSCLQRKKKALIHHLLCMSSFWMGKENEPQHFALIHVEPLGVGKAKFRKLNSTHEYSNQRKSSASKVSSSQCVSPILLALSGLPNLKQIFFYKMT